MNRPLPMITEQNGRPVTTSRAVAEQFGKRHTEVIRAIQNTIEALQGSEGGKEFSQRNFASAEYVDAQGKPRPSYILTRDGFTLLAMGFTGATALQFKIAYIDAFNRMEQIIKSGTNAAALLHIEERLAALESAAESGAGEVTDTVAASFLKALQSSLDSGESYIRRRKEEERRGQLLGFIERDCIALRKRTAYSIYAEKVKDPVPHGALWSILRRAGVAFPEDYKEERFTCKEHCFRAIYIKPDKLSRKPVNP